MCTSFLKAVGQAGADAGDAAADPLAAGVDGFVPIWVCRPPPPPPPPPRTKWTCRVPHAVLIGHAASPRHKRDAHLSPLPGTKGTHISLHCLAQTGRRLVLALSARARRR